VLIANPTNLFISIIPLPLRAWCLTLAFMPRRGMRIKVRGNKKISSKSSAKKLRSNATDAEVKLWSALKNRQLEGEDKGEGEIKFSFYLSGERKCLPTVI
jgi:hypothetical protein